MFAKGREDMVGSGGVVSLEYEAWAQRRLAALDKMEIKLREMRELAVYAASRSLSEREVAQVQEWVNILQAEVIAIDKESACDPSLQFSITPMSILLKTSQGKNLAS